MRLQIRVIPNAKVSKIVGWTEDRVLKIKIAAVAEDGKANEALIDFLSSALKIKKRDITLISGATSRLKILDGPFDLDYINSLSSSSS